MSANRALGLGVILAVIILPRQATARFEDAPGEPAREATELNVEAQRLYADGQLADAARTYAQILTVLPENPVNVQERDNVLLLTHTVYREAYERVLAGTEADARERAAALLCEVEAHDEAYRAAFRAAYEGSKQPSNQVLESGAELQRTMDEAQASSGAPLCPVPDDSGAPTAPNTPTLGGVDRCDEYPNDCDDYVDEPSGAGLIVAGALTMAAGLGTSSMIIVGGARRREADNVLNREASPEATEAEMATLAGEQEAARKDRSRANGLIVAGSVVTGVLVAGGATMLGIGTRRRMRYMAFTPATGRGYVGFSLQGRF